MIKIFIPSQIANNYTNGIHELNAKGDKLDQVITSLDKQYPGIKSALSEGFACALENEIVHDWFDEELDNVRSVRFIPAIEGG